MSPFNYSPDAEFARFVLKENESTRRSYLAKPGLIQEHYGIEVTVLSGGYGYRQIIELIQNGADAIFEAHDNGCLNNDDRIEVKLTNECLYVANTGAPFSKEGLEALLMSHRSTKSGNQIGRFGLGFKSLLGLKGRIDLFSKTNGSVYFDPRCCQQELCDEFHVDEAPELRLAWPIEADDDVWKDPVLNDFQWAETLVRAEIKNLYSKLDEELNSFRAGFLLFFTVSTQLVLIDEKSQRSLSVERKERDRMILKDGENEEEWLVVSRDEKITDSAALEDAGELHRRSESIPISWAFPIKSKRSQEAGHFWAFFPTDTPSGIAGIVNAPWKLNSDRKGVIKGEWSNALMCKAAELIAENLPKLYDETDPGRLLDAFPRLDKVEIAEKLVDELWRQLESREVIANGLGVLCRIQELKLHPEIIDEKLVKLAEDWMALASQECKAEFIHPTCFSNRDRNARLKEFAKRSKIQAAAFSDWFNRIATTDTEKSLGVLRLAKLCKEKMMPEWDWRHHDRSLQIIPTRDGQLVTSENAILASEPMLGRQPVASYLLENEEALAILRDVLKVLEPGPEAWKDYLQKSYNAAVKSLDNDECWTKFWEILRTAPPVAVDEFFKSAYNLANTIRIKRNDGNWVTRHEVLKPGCCIDQDNPFAVHVEEHAQDDELLTKLGLSDLPVCTLDSRFDAATLSMFVKYIKAWNFTTFMRNDDEDFYKCFDTDYSSDYKLPACYPLFMVLRGQGNARVTNLLLDSLVAGPTPTVRAYIQNSLNRRQKHYISIIRPLFWLLAAYGTIEIGGYFFTLSELTNLDKSCAEILSRHVPAYKIWRDSIGDQRFATSASVNKNDLWQAIIETAVTEESLRTDDLEDLWIACAEDDCIPSFLPLGDGKTIDISQVYVTSSKQLAELARSSFPDIHVIFLSRREIAQQWIDRGACDLGQFVTFRDEPGCEPGDIRDHFPGIRSILDDKKTYANRPVVELQLCLEAKEPLPVSCLIWNGELFWDKEIFQSLSPKDQHVAMLREMIDEGWVSGDLKSLLEKIGFVPQVRKKRLKEESFICSVSLGGLHYFQEDVMNSIKELLFRDVPRRRAVVRLPTGAGKTRVTVQAAVEWILKPEGNHRSVLWIAQKDELCEQAVEKFRQVWCNYGEPETNLRVIRLWGGLWKKDFPAPPKENQPVVVVSTNLTLNKKRMDGLEWLRDPGLVVIDECHHATTRTYTGILHWIDAPPSIFADVKKESPVLGLSATPLRDKQEESKRLAKRFGEEIFPKDHEQLDKRLCQEGFLSEVEYTSLSGQLTDELVTLVEKLAKESDNTQRERIRQEINKYFSENQYRNDLIVKTITEAPESSILLFASTRKHSEEMAKRLQMKGIKAAHIDGKTPWGDRQYFLDQFKKGRIRVLCNFGVLTTGFDAPKTDLIVISRYVGSWVLFMQMVGRGLRGPKNGGTEKCRIATWQENINNYSEQLNDIILEYYKK